MDGLSANEVAGPALVELASRRGATEMASVVRRGDRIGVYTRGDRIGLNIWRNY